MPSHESTYSKQIESGIIAGDGAHFVGQTKDIFFQVAQTGRLYTQNPSAPSISSFKFYFVLPSNPPVFSSFQIASQPNKLTFNLCFLPSNPSVPNSFPTKETCTVSSCFLRLWHSFNSTEPEEKTFYKVWEWSMDDTSPSPS